MEHTQNSGRWTPAEIVVLKSGYFGGRDTETIATELGRSVSSVQAQVYRLGLACEKKRCRTIPKIKPAKMNCMPTPFVFMQKK